MSAVTVPEQRRIAKRHRDTPLPRLAKLVGSPIHEHRLTGFLIRTEQFRKADEEARARLFAFCRKHLMLRYAIEKPPPQRFRYFMERWEHLSTPCQTQ